MPSFPGRLKELRTTKGVTQKFMAEFLHITETSYQYYEYGKREPNHETTIKLADYFNVSTDYLLGRSDNPTRQ
jgi:transcriptional regulator with XRE-family HTH domain